MCWACQEAEQEAERERTWQLVEIISTGQMPAGHTADDLRAMGLPQPGELIRETQSDGSVLIKQVAPSKIKPANAFVCDTPDNSTKKSTKNLAKNV